MNKFKRFVDRNGATILSVVATVGVVGTSVLAAKGALKASKLLEEATLTKEEELTTAEKVKVAAPAYVPALLMGASTVACIFGANVLNKRTQTALMGAYALMDRSIKELKKKAIDIYGEDAVDNIQAAIAKDKYKKDDALAGESQTPLFFDEFSMRYFNSDAKTILAAEFEISDRIWNDDRVTFNEYCELVGLPFTDYGDSIGWDGYSMYHSNQDNHFKFSYKKIPDYASGMECVIISIPEPTLL